jgi:integrase
VVYSGLRREELFHLRWEDLKAGELNVVSRQDHPTKNRESRRIPLCEPLSEALSRHPRRLGCPYVFANPAGKAYNDVRKSLDKAALRAGIRDKVGLHQLRHAFCSHALMSGIDARTVQRWMGHKSLTTTMKYAHVSPDHEKAAIQRLRYESRHQVGTGTDNQ